jgi:hypothetical protein
MSEVVRSARILMAWLIAIAAARTSFAQSKGISGLEIGERKAQKAKLKMVVKEEARLTTRAQSMPTLQQEFKVSLEQAKVLAREQARKLADEARAAARGRPEI